MDRNKRVRSKRTQGLAARCSLLFDVSLQVPGGFLHAIVYPINRFTGNRGNVQRLTYNLLRKELEHAE